MTAAAFRLSLLVVTLLGCAGNPAPPPPATPGWAALAAVRLPLLKPCRPPNAPEDLLCGTLDVWEDRAAAHGRKIGLKVIVVPAQNPAPPPDPVFVFEGGPGGAVTRRAGSMTYAGPVRDRDIVLVDQRGTGGSGPLDCKLGGGELGGDNHLGKLAEMFPVEDVRRCARQLSDRTDLRFYTSEHFVDDIEEVRRRLGYGPINIRGGSYGTWTMMTFAQRHPKSTRSLFGIGVVSPVRSNLAERGVWSDRVLARLTAFCDASEACAAIAPNMGSKVAELLDGLDAGPRRVEIADPNAPESRLTLTVGRDWLTEQLRLILYYTFTSRALPWAVHRAHGADDWEPLVQLAVILQRMFQSNLSYGIVLTVQCSEGMNFDVDEAMARGAETLFGNYRLEQQIQGCANWPHSKRPPLGVDTPRVLDIPTLLLSGALDPVTPPEYADEAAEFFPNSRHIVLPEGQHGPFDLTESWECIHGLWAEFLERGEARSLDASCTEAMRRPPALTEGASFAAYLKDELAPMAQ